jgi:hypothetical protein
MKKNFTISKLTLGLFLIAGFLLTANKSSAQSFRILPEKTIKKAYNLSDEPTIDAYIENTSMSDIHLKWSLLANTLPDLKWDFSLCDNGTCYSGIPDSATFPVTKPGEKASLKLTIIFTEGTSKAGKGTTQFLVYNINDESDADTITFEADVVTGIFEIVPTDKKISIYPNPATDVINIVSTDLNITKGNMSIYNALGAKVNDIILTPSGFNTVSVSNLPAGVYYVRFQGTTGEVSTRTFLKK